jgi:hypothetical protein
MPDAPKCDKECAAVFHMTGHRHRTDCAAYDDSPGCPTCGAPRPDLHPHPTTPCLDAFHGGVAVPAPLGIGPVKHRVRFAVLWGSELLHAEGDFYLPTQARVGRFLPAELLVLKDPAAPEGEADKTVAKET